jgi:hypothetical protein
MGAASNAGNEKKVQHSLIFERLIRRSESCVPRYSRAGYRQLGIHRAAVSLGLGGSDSGGNWNHRLLPAIRAIRIQHVQEAGVDRPTNRKIACGQKP